MVLLSFFKAYIKILKNSRLVHVFIHQLTWILYILFRVRNNLKITGTRYLPPRRKPRYILAPNHSSSMDFPLFNAILMGRFLRRIYILTDPYSFSQDNLEKLLVETLEEIPRLGTGDSIVKVMARNLLNNRPILIAPEGMKTATIGRGHTGIIRLYYRVNRCKSVGDHVPIIPIGVIGGTKAYPPRRADDGRYHYQKTSIILRFGPPIVFDDLPDALSHAWLREKTDLVMAKIARLALTD
jgi:1-acyl-sn-glycerol-3-phosphate acyltransferase